MHESILGSGHIRLLYVKKKFVKRIDSNNFEVEIELVMLYRSIYLSTRIILQSFHTIEKILSFTDKLPKDLLICNDNQL